MCSSMYVLCIKQIHAIAVGTFDMLTKLERLNLADNQVKSIGECLLSVYQLDDMQTPLIISYWSDVVLQW